MHFWKTIYTRQTLLVSVKLRLRVLKGILSEQDHIKYYHFSLFEMYREKVAQKLEIRVK